MIFSDRVDAGFHLACELLRQPEITQAEASSLLILSIPRGGVIIGNVVARFLGCSHDMLIVKKIGFPGHEQLAMGAAAEDGTVLLNREMISWYNLPPEKVRTAIIIARDKVREYVKTLRHEKPLDVTGKTVILVDDGVATGETLKAAIRWLSEENHHAGKVIVAIPVCSPDTIAELEAMADKVICLYVPDDFAAVGQYYRNFEQVSEKEVLDMLYAHHA